MAIKVEVVTPVASVSQVTGASTAITVVNGSQSPITTNNNQAVVEVVGKYLVTGVVALQTEPAVPHEGMVWLSW